MSTDLDRLLAAADAHDGPIVALTGAGISAESGIPTFRGTDGYWRIGSANYQPQEIATFAMFRREPEAVWAWYLMRIGACRDARPNPAHDAIARLERELPADAFQLVTQNVDGLHAGAGSRRLFAIHGDIRTLRCSAECSNARYPLPDDLPVPERDAGTLPSDVVDALRCPRCGAWLRPHVLWFDECYDEENYRFESALAVAERCRLLLVVGTTGATTLPAHILSLVAARGVPFVVVDPHANDVTRAAERHARGLWLDEAAATAVPRIVAALLAR